MITFFGIPIWNSIFNLSYESSNSSNGSKGLQRSPANTMATQSLQNENFSAQPHPTNKINLNKDQSTIQVHCDQSKGVPDSETTSSFVQFIGKRCNKSENIHEQIVIFNETNGFTASLFDVGSNQYQTDLIQLRKGFNQIKIKFRIQKNKFIERIIKINSQY